VMRIRLSLKTELGFGGFYFSGDDHSQPQWGKGIYKQISDL